MIDILLIVGCCGSAATSGCPADSTYLQDMLAEFITLIITLFITLNTCYEKFLLMVMYAATCYSSSAVCHSM